MADEVRILGKRELYEALSTVIPRNMEGKILQKALAAGTALVLRDARINATRGGERFPNKRSGTLRRALYAKRSKFNQSPTMEIRVVGVRKGRRAAKKGRDAWYARLVEYGHRTRASAKRLGAVRWVPGRPFMRPAWEANKERALEAILRKLQELLADAERKARW